LLSQVEVQEVQLQAQVEVLVVWPPVHSQSLAQPQLRWVLEVQDLLSLEIMVATQYSVPSLVSVVVAAVQTAAAQTV